MLHDLINEKPENVVVSTVAVAPSALPANVSEASLAATPSLVHPTVAVASALAIFRAQDDNHASTDDDHASIDDAYNQNSAEVSRLDYY
mmetsp:Transcript_20384/g.26284  ORF Transcript_20384/g.26284 Transcript_20384/m.26284 type:complete len:89 (-) Transcript_20384:13-279(-)